MVINSIRHHNYGSSSETNRLRKHGVVWWKHSVHFNWHRAAHCCRHNSISNKSFEQRDNVMIKASILRPGWITNLSRRHWSLQPGQHWHHRSLPLSRTEYPCSVSLLLSLQAMLSSFSLKGALSPKQPLLQREQDLLILRRSTKPSNAQGLTVTMNCKEGSSVKRPAVNVSVTVQSAGELDVSQSLRLRIKEAEW